MPKIESTTLSVASSARTGLVATPRRRIPGDDKENQAINKTPSLSMNVKIEGPEPVEVSHRLAKKTWQSLSSAGSAREKRWLLKDVSHTIGASLSGPTVTRMGAPPPPIELDSEHPATIGLPQQTPCINGLNSATRSNPQPPQEPTPTAVLEQEDFEMQTRRLQRSEKRLKLQLLQLKEDIKDVRVELQETRTEFLNAMERLDEEETRARELETGVDRYRRWWVNEYHFVRLLLQMVPDPREVEVIAASSHARYRAVFED